MNHKNKYAHNANGTTNLIITQRNGTQHVYLIDTSDFEFVSQHQWTYTSSGYAYRAHRVNGKRTTLYLHRYMMNAPEGICVDHINGDVREHRRHNLRLATVSQNQQNRSANKRSETQIKGIRRFERNNVPYLKAEIACDGVAQQKSWSIRVHGEEQAFEAATQWIKTTRIRLHGEYARHA
jgi:hypothetical protein